MTTRKTRTRAFGRASNAISKGTLGLICCALGACAPSESSPSTSTGGSSVGIGPVGAGGAITTGGAMGTGGAITGSGGTTSSPGTGGATTIDNGTGGSATGGAATGGAATGTGGAVVGGGGRGGGTAATGGAAGGSDGTVSGSCKGVFCDDFEAGTTLGAGWTVNNTLGATVKVVNTYTTTPGPTMAHSGKNAVQISFPAGAGYAFLVEKAGFPAPMGYWGRVWLYIETPTTDAGHDVYIEGSTGMNLSNYGVRPLNTQKGDMTINISPVGTAEAGANTTTPIPRGVWTCFEWQISATGANGNVVLYAGGSTAPTVSLNGKLIPALVEHHVGYERYAAGTAGNLWIDDYAMGTARIGCM